MKFTHEFTTKFGNPTWTGKIKFRVGLTRYR